MLRQGTVVTRVVSTGTTATKTVTYQLLTISIVVPKVFVELENSTPYKMVCSQVNIVCPGICGAFIVKRSWTIYMPSKVSILAYV